MERNISTDSEIEILSPPAKVDMADDWYEFANLQHFWIQGRFNALKQNLGTIDLSGKALFEIGSGNGLIINQFEQAYDTQVDGCDLNMFALKQTRNNRGRLFCLNIFDPPASFKLNYDGVLLMDVIEHIVDDSGFLRASLQYVKNGGLVMINVPAFNTFFSDYDAAAGHKRRYDKQMMARLFEKNNITPVRMAYWGFTMVPLVLLRKLLLKITGNQNTIRTGFRPPNQMTNWLFQKMLSLENRMLPSPFIGTSLIAIGKVNRHG